MKTPYFTYGLLLILCLALPGCQPAEPSSNAPVSLDTYRSPQRYERDINRFEQADKQAMPPAGAVLFAGSSSVRLWHNKLSEDFLPLTVFGRGFGGSNMNDLLYFADRIVIKYRPRAVVIYEGENDIAQDIHPAVVAEAFKRLLNKIDAKLPGCRVYVLSAKPSLKRWILWPRIRDLNERLSAVAKQRKNVTYIDVATPMLGKDGNPRRELFVKDRLHLNREGYLLWRDTIRPVLMKAEREYEK